MKSTPPWRMALANAATALVLSAILFVVVGWATDWYARQFGGRYTMPPTVIATLYGASEIGWPIVAIATVIGLLGKTLDGLPLVLVATYLLGMVDSSSALIVGSVCTVRISFLSNSEPNGFDG